MKEYLNEDYQLVLSDNPSESWIEVPKGKNRLYAKANDGLYSFWVDGEQMHADNSHKKTRNGMSFDDWVKTWDAEILWSSEHKEPIQQEYLNKTSEGWKLIVLEDGQTEDENLIRVPDGAERYAKDSMFGHKRTDFYKENAVYIDNMWMRCNFSHADGEILWQRLPEFKASSGEQLTRHAELLGVKGSNKTDDELREELLAILSHDNVNKPSHYCSHPSRIECIEITRHHDFAIGNAIKYLWRAGLKDSENEVQDLEKAIFYIKDKINQIKGK